MPATIYAARHADGNTMNNSGDTELAERTNTNDRLSEHSERIRQSAQPSISQNSTTHNLINEVTLSRNTATPTRSQNLESNIDNERRIPMPAFENHTADSPPTYNDTIQQSQVTSETSEQFFLLPSYDEFICRNNGR